MAPVERTSVNELNEDNIPQMLRSIMQSNNEIRESMKKLNSKMDNTITIIQNLETTCQALDKRLTIIEQTNNEIADRVSAVETNQNSTESQVNAIQTDLNHINKAIGTEIHEQMNRYQRRLNIMVMGIPENADAAKTLKKLFEIIWPGQQLPPWSRIGEEKPEKTRPVRITVGSAEERRTIFGNCKLLKNLVQFKGISVKKDLTKQQQAEVKHNYATRAVTKENTLRNLKSRENKRKADSDDETGEPSQKRISHTNQME